MYSKLSATNVLHVAKGLAGASLSLWYNLVSFIIHDNKQIKLEFFFPAMNQLTQLANMQAQQRIIDPRGVRPPYPAGMVPQLNPRSLSSYPTSVSNTPLSAPFNMRNMNPNIYKSKFYFTFLAHLSTKCSRWVIVITICPLSVRQHLLL